MADYKPDPVEELTDVERVEGWEWLEANTLPEGWIGSLEAVAPPEEDEGWKYGD